MSGVRFRISLVGGKASWHYYSWPVVLGWAGPIGRSFELLLLRALVHDLRAGKGCRMASAEPERVGSRAWASKLAGQGMPVQRMEDTPVAVEGMPVQRMEDILVAAVEDIPAAVEGMPVQRMEDTLVAAVEDTPAAVDDIPAAVAGSQGSPAVVGILPSLMQLSVSRCR